MTNEPDNRYKSIFRKYYQPLLYYARRLVCSEEAEDVVQDSFIELWKRNETIVIEEQIRAFLYRSVYTRSLNIIKHRQITEGYEALTNEINHKRAAYYHPDNNEVIQRIENNELHKEIVTAINELPEKCREAFKLSYIHDMKDKEIADVMNISPRTVGAHISKALKYLRTRLDPFFSLLMFFFATSISKTLF